MLLGPPLHHNFLFRVELHSITALSVQHAKEAVFPSAEWKVRHGRSHSNVDANVARRRFITEPSCCRAAGCKQRRLVPKRTLPENPEPHPGHWHAQDSAPAQKSL